MADLAEEIRTKVRYNFEWLTEGADPFAVGVAEEMRDAILAVLDEHQQSETHIWEVPRRPDGQPRIHLNPWCRCQEHDGMAHGEGEWPCPTLVRIAKALGIAIHDSRIEGGDG